MGRVIILRGPSGAGKTTLVLNNGDDFGDQVTVVSADHLFERKSSNGQVEYDFDPRNLTQAHHECMEAFLTALLEGCENIVVDNTNIRRWEYRNYELAARLANYEVTIVEIIPGNAKEVELCSSRNTHNVPDSVIVSQVTRFEPDSRAIRLPIKI